MIEPKLSIDDLKLAATLIKEGLAVEDVADKFDVSKYYLYNRLSDMGMPVRALTETLDNLKKMTISELRMIGLEDIPTEPTVVMIKRKPTHVLMTLDTYRALAHGA